jgi:raffinose/stachyose/melibiose transport system permease protein
MSTRADRLGTYVILTIFSVIACAPLVVMMGIALRPGPGGSGLDFSNFARVWNEGHFQVYLHSSVIVSAAVVALAGTLSILAGYALGTMRLLGGNLVFYLFLVGLVVPSEAIIVPLYFDLRSFNLVDTYWSLILPEAALSLSFGIFWMRAFFRAVPRSLIEAARIDGASSLRILSDVLLPPALPAILTMVVLMFMWSWNEFFLPLVMISTDDLRTAPVGLGYFQGQYTTDTTGLAAASAILAAPIVLVYILLQRHFTQGLLSGGVKG